MTTGSLLHKILEVFVERNMDHYRSDDVGPSELAKRLASVANEVLDTAEIQPSLSEDGLAVGTVSAPPGKLEPTIRPFADLVNTQAAAEAVTAGAGMIPFDATLGNAHKMEATRETLLEHVQKGGVIIYPILGMAALAALVAAVK